MVKEIPDLSHEEKLDIILSILNAHNTYIALDILKDKMKIKDNFIILNLTKELIEDGYIQERDIKTYKITKNGSYLIRQNNGYTGKANENHELYFSK